jgi:hypothetical protein
MKVLLALSREMCTVVHMNGKARLVAAVAAILAASGALLVAIASPQANADWEGQLNRCFAGVTVKNALSPEKIGCVEQVYRAAGNRGELPEVITILGRIADQNRDPHRFTVCHHASHRFGPTAVEQLGGVMPAIEALSTPTCGFIHGPYDIFGREMHTFDEWVKMVRVCEDTKLRFGHDVQCSDALGHALSQSVMHRGTDPGERLFSAKICAEFKDRGGRLDCGEALIMERYGPLDPSIEPEDPVEPKMLMQSCLDLPTDILDAREACASGVGWYLSELAGNKFREMYIEGGPSNYSDLLYYIRDACEAGGEEIAGFCMRRMFSLVDITVIQNAERATKFCRREGIGPWSRDCFMAFRFRQSQEVIDDVIRLNSDLVPDLATQKRKYPSEPVMTLEEYQQSLKTDKQSISQDEAS